MRRWSSPARGPAAATRPSRARDAAAAELAGTRPERRRRPGALARVVAGALAVVALAGGWAAAGRAALPDVPAAPARHAAVTAPADPAAQRAALRRALALVGFRDRLGYRLVLAPPRPGVRAETDTGARTITLHLDPADAPHRVAHDIAHELGHAWDSAHLDDAGRRAYLRARGAAGAGWWPDSRTADYGTGAGDFAEVFARCHAASPEFRSRLAPAPADACAVLPAAARGGW
jgi:hypothetical protein